MSRKGYYFSDYGIEEEIDPKIKLNSLISVTTSTIMCLAARCPLPKSNVETTKLFLSTITDDNGQTPRNINAFLSLLNNYSGPYESDTCKDKRLNKSVEKPKEKDTDPGPKITHKESGPLVESMALVKRSPRMGIKKLEKDSGMKKSINKNVGSKISLSKSLISKF